MGATAGPQAETNMNASTTRDDRRELTAEEVALVSGANLIAVGAVLGIGAIGV